MSTEVARPGMSVRKREIVKLVYALVLSASSDDSGVLAAAMKRYNTEARGRVVRGAFYAWLDDEMANLMIGGGGDWLRVVPAGSSAGHPRHGGGLVHLRDIYPGSGSAAAVKVHKELSVGRGA